MPICLRLFWHWARAAASRTFWTAGNSSPIRMAMMAMTTSNSISVNAGREAERTDLMDYSPGDAVRAPSANNKGGRRAEQGLGGSNYCEYTIATAWRSSGGFAMAKSTVRRYKELRLGQRCAFCECVRHK